MALSQAWRLLPNIPLGVHILGWLPGICKNRPTSLDLTPKAVKKHKRRQPVEAIPNTDRFSQAEG
jgi:hypothetical protein